MDAGGAELAGCGTDLMRFALLLGEVWCDWACVERLGKPFRC
jgi:hypothetical protein